MSGQDRVDLCLPFCCGSTQHSGVERLRCCSHNDPNPNPTPNFSLQLQYSKGSPDVDVYEQMDKLGLSERSRHLAASSGKRLLYRIPLN